MPTKTFLAASLVILTLPILVAEQSSVTYQNGSLVDLKYHKNCSSFYQGTNSCYYYVNYIVQISDKTYEGQCRDRLVHGCWDHFVIHDPVEVRMEGNKLILKRPDGKEVKTTIVRTTSNSQEETKTQEEGTVSVASVPPTADIYADGSFVGNSPANLRLAPGEHKIEIKADGFKEWSRKITVLAGSNLTLSASLEQQ